MRSQLIVVSMIFGALVVATVIAFEGRDLAKHVGLAEEEPVLVFVIPGVENARRVRAAIKPERIVWQGKEGLALAGGRVLALNLDSAGDVIELAGWVDRPIQIVRLDDPQPEQDAASDGASREERLVRLRSLVSKPTLSRGEQMFIMSAMNDGLEI